MTSERDIFTVAGPIHLMKVNWESLDHRRSIAASLVQAVYVLERDRQLNLKDSEALAPPWWDFFQFELVRKLVDDADFSIFGAVFKLKPSTSNDSCPARDAPKFVIAFRGTMTTKESVSRDIMLDLQVVQNGLHQTTRYQLALQAVQNLVSAAGSPNVWLTGHSLGSAVATLVGKNMAKSGILLETFLYNPPFLSAPIERIKDQNVKKGLRFATSVVTVGLALALGNQRKKSVENESFVLLSSWVPRLFVNPDDHICSEYIGYFEHRKHMDEIGAGGIERLATQNSIPDIVLGAFGRESDPVHLLPSANLTINLSPCPDFRWAHSLHQWWQPDLTSESKEYHFNH